MNQTNCEMCQTYPVSFVLNDDDYAYDLLCLRCSAHALDGADYYDNLVLEFI